jgi:hypothetical protein
VLDHSSISTVATVAFLVQGPAWLWFGVLRRKLTFKTQLSPMGIVGGALVAYAAMIYPSLAIWTATSSGPAPTSAWSPCLDRRRS